MRPRTRLVLAVLATGALALGPAITTAAAPSSLGRTGTPISSSCGGLTLLQPTSPGGQYAAPTDGVITSWRFVPGMDLPSSVAFKVGRGTAPAGVSVVSSGPLIPVADAATLDVATRVPVKAGDYIGLAFQGGSPDCIIGVPAGSGYKSVGATGNVGVGPLTTAFEETDRPIDVSATFETDADGDGFGDTSQDLCPTDKNTQAACGTGAPETTLSSLTAKKAKKANKKAAMTATFSASEASTFECAVDSASFAPCASPFTAKLKVGTHSFAVRATDTAGNLDRTAAVKTFKIKVAKKK